MYRCVENCGSIFSTGLVLGVRRLQRQGIFQDHRLVHTSPFRWAWQDGWIGTQLRRLDDLHYGVHWYTACLSSWQFQANGSCTTAPLAHCQCRKPTLPCGSDPSAVICTQPYAGGELERRCEARLAENQIPRSAIERASERLTTGTIGGVSSPLLSHRCKFQQHEACCAKYVTGR